MVFTETDEGDDIGLNYSHHSAPRWQQMMPLKPLQSHMTPPRVGIKDVPNGGVILDTPGHDHPLEMLVTPQHPIGTQHLGIGQSLLLPLPHKEIHRQSTVQDYQQLPECLAQCNENCSLDSDQELERCSRQIRLELRQREMLELAAEAERAAEAGVESFTGRASTFGDDKDLVVLNSKEENVNGSSTPSSRRNLTSHNLRGTPYSNMIRSTSRARKKLGVLALRDVNEVVPSFREFHMHIRTHLARRNVQKTTLIFNPNPPNSAYTSQYTDHLTTNNNHDLCGSNDAGAHTINFLTSFNFPSWGSAGVGAGAGQDEDYRTITNCLSDVGELLADHIYKPYYKEVPRQLRKAQLDIPPDPNLATIVQKQENAREKTVTNNLPSEVVMIQEKNTNLIFANSTMAAVPALFPFEIQDNLNTPNLFSECAQDRSKSGSSALNEMHMPHTYNLSSSRVPHKTENIDKKSTSPAKTPPNGLTVNEASVSNQEKLDNELLLTPTYFNRDYRDTKIVVGSDFVTPARLRDIRDGNGVFNMKAETKGIPLSPSLSTLSRLGIRDMSPDAERDIASVRRSSIIRDEMSFLNLNNPLEERRASVLTDKFLNLSIEADNVSSPSRSSSFTDHIHGAVNTFLMRVLSTDKADQWQKTQKGNTQIIENSQKSRGEANSELFQFKDGFDEKKESDNDKLISNAGNTEGIEHTKSVKESFLERMDSRSEIFASRDQKEESIATRRVQSLTAETFISEESFHCKEVVNELNCLEVQDSVSNTSFEQIGEERLLNFEGNIQIEDDGNDLCYLNDEVPFRESSSVEESFAKSVGLKERLSGVTENRWVQLHVEAKDENDNVSEDNDNKWQDLSNEFDQQLSTILWKSNNSRELNFGYNGPTSNKSVDIDWRRSYSYNESVGFGRKESPRHTENILGSSSCFDSIKSKSFLQDPPNLNDAAIRETQRKEPTPFKSRSEVNLDLFNSQAEANHELVLGAQSNSGASICGMMQYEKVTAKEPSFHNDEKLRDNVHNDKEEVSSKSGSFLVEELHGAAIDFMKSTTSIDEAEKINQANFISTYNRDREILIEPKKNWTDEMDSIKHNFLFSKQTDLEIIVDHRIKSAKRNEHMGGKNRTTVNESEYGVRGALQGDIPLAVQCNESKQSDSSNKTADCQNHQCNCLISSTSSIESYGAGILSDEEEMKHKESDIRVKDMANKSASMPLFAAAGMFSQLSPRSYRIKDKERAMALIHIPSQDNDAFLSNYLYCSKREEGRPDKSESVCTEPCQDTRIPCGDIAVDACVGNLVDSAMKLFPKKYSDGVQHLSLGRNDYRKMQSETWYDLANEHIDGLFDRLLGNAQDRSNQWNISFQAPALKKNKMSPVLSGRSSKAPNHELIDSNEATPLHIDKQIHPIALLRDSNAHRSSSAFHQRQMIPSNRRPLSENQVQLTYGMPRERPIAITTAGSAGNVDGRISDRFDNTGVRNNGRNQLGTWIPTNNQRREYRNRHAEKYRSHDTNKHQSSLVEKKRMIHNESSNTRYKITNSNKQRPQKFNYSTILSRHSY